MQQSSSLLAQQVISQFDSSLYQHIIEEIFLKKYLFIFNFITMYLLVITYHARPFGVHLVYLGCQMFFYTNRTQEGSNYCHYNLRLALLDPFYSHLYICVNIHKRSYIAMLSVALSY